MTNEKNAQEFTSKTYLFAMSMFISGLENNAWGNAITFTIKNEAIRSRRLGEEIMVSVYFGGVLIVGVVCVLCLALWLV
jgi:hypothetical protein